MGYRDGECCCIKTLCSRVHVRFSLLLETVDHAPVCSLQSQKHVREDRMSNTRRVWSSRPHVWNRTQYFNLRTDTQRLAGHQQETIYCRARCGPHQSCRVPRVFSSSLNAASTDIYLMGAGVQRRDLLIHVLLLEIFVDRPRVPAATRPLPC